MGVSFEQDIVPIFRQFRASMIWRLDLIKYEDMKVNWDAVWSNIQPGGGMPPTPYPALTAEQLATFKAWKQEGFPR